MNPWISIYISVDGTVYEVTYNRNLYRYNDVIHMISSAIEKFKNDHDMWSWDEEISSELEIKELGSLPFGKKLSMKKSTDPAIDNDDDIDIYDELYSDDEEDDDYEDIEDDDIDVSDDDSGDITDW